MKTRENNSDNGFRENLLNLMREYLGDREVIDPQGRKILLSKDFPEKYGNPDSADKDKLIELLKYIKCVDETVVSPIETWLAEDKITVRYFKAYSNLACIVVTIDDKLVDFEIVFPDRYSYIDSLRCGYLLFS